jgi:hypothetical protein
MSAELISEANNRAILDGRAIFEAMLDRIKHKPWQNLSIEESVNIL